MGKTKAPQERVDAGLVEEDYERQPSNDAVADGEHLGETDDFGLVQSAPSAFSNPYVSEEEQGMEMRPVIVGPPSYGSPDPLTSAGKLVALEDHPLTADKLPEGHPAAVSSRYGQGYDGTLTGSETVTQRPGAGARSDLERHASGDFSVEANAEVNATDGAKELANEHGVDLRAVEGSGEDGRITKADVEDHLAAQESDDDEE